MVNERRWLMLIFSLYFLLAVGYSLLMPIWEAPDEPAHYHLAWHLVLTGKYASYKLNYEAQQPRAYYYFASWVIRGLNLIDPHSTDYFLPKEYKYNIRMPVRRFGWTDENYRFLLGEHVLRWINILFGGAALWLNWKAFKLIVPEKPTLQLGAVALAGLTPQYLHIMSSINNDALGTLAGAVLLFLTVRFLTKSSNYFALLLILLAILLPLSTKLTVLPVSVAVLLIVVWQWFMQFPQKRWLFYSGISVMIAAGIFYFLFPNVFDFAISEVKWRLTSLHKNALTVKYIKAISGQIISTFWGNVGWLAVELPKWMFYFLTAFGLSGMALQARELMKRDSVYVQKNIWLAVWLIVVCTILAVFRNGLTTFATQGRFLFPVMGALSLLMVAGWHSVASEPIQRFFPALIVLLFLSCNMILWLSGILPVYYQPFLD